MELRDLWFKALGLGIRIQYLGSRVLGFNSVVSKNRGPRVFGDLITYDTGQFHILSTSYILKAIHASARN